MGVKSTLNNMKKQLHAMSETIDNAYKYNEKYIKAYAEFTEKDNFIESIINKPCCCFGKIKSISDERNAKAKYLRTVFSELTTENMPLSLDFDEMAIALNDILDDWKRKNHLENMNEYFEEIENDISDIIELYGDTNMIIDEILTAKDEIISVIDDII